MSVSDRYGIYNGSPPFATDILANMYKLTSFFFWSGCDHFVYSETSIKWTPN